MVDVVALRKAVRGEVGIFLDFGFDVLIDICVLHTLFFDCVRPEFEGRDTDGAFDAV